MESVFKVNQKVQAVDELGRWENGVIREVDDDGAAVHFPGYDCDCDRVVSWGELRLRMPPFEEQQRSK